MTRVCLFYRGMFKVNFRQRGKSDAEEDLLVMLPGDFGAKDFADYLNNIKNTFKQYYFFTQQQKWTPSQRLVEVGHLEEILLVEYEEEREGEVKSVTSSFPDWIKRIVVSESLVYSAGYDGAVRKGDQILHEFGKPIQALDVHNSTVICGTEGEMACIYPNNTKKVKATTQLSCVRVKEEDSDGVLHIHSGHYDGKLVLWRVSKKKGFLPTLEKQLEGCVNEILPASNGQYFIITSQRVYLYGGDSLSVVHKSGFQCAALKDDILVTGSPDGTLSLFQLICSTSFQLKHRTQVDGAIKWISSVAILDDGRIISVGHDGNVRIYTSALQHLQTLPISPVQKLLTCHAHNHVLYVAGEECIVKSIYFQ